MAIMSVPMASFCIEEHLRTTDSFAPARAKNLRQNATAPVFAGAARVNCELEQDLQEEDQAETVRRERPADVASSSLLLRCPRLPPDTEDRRRHATQAHQRKVSKSRPALGHCTALAAALVPSPVPVAATIVGGLRSRALGRRAPEVGPEQQQTSRGLT